MNTPPVALGRLARFWLPLQATWLMMAVEGPLLTAIIARLAEPRHNLAAYGVAFAFAIIVEAPVIMMMSASTALVDSRPGYLALRRFAQALNAVITTVMVLLLATPAMAWILDGLLGLDPRVAELTHRALWILLPWPAAIGYRRFYQGILIRAGLTRRVAWGTGLRLVAMATGAALAALAGLPGTLVGAVALSSGVCIEGAASRLMARPALRALPGERPPSRAASDLTWRGLWAFYWPLALTSTVSLAVHPLVTFFMGRARAPLESLAVVPVLNALVFVFRTPALSLQEVAIAWLGESRRHMPAVLRFAGLLGTLATLGLAVVVWTPVSALWFGRISGLDPELVAFTLVPARILTVMPALSVLLNLQRALLVHGHRTGPVTTASVLEVLGIAVILAAGVIGVDAVGATAAAAAYLAGRLAANAWLLRPARQVIDAPAPRA